MRNITILSPLLLFFVLSFGTMFAADEAKELLNLENIWKKYKYSEKGVGGIRPLKDGLHFSNLQFDTASGYTNVLAYDYKTGAVTDTIFKGDWLKPEDGLAVVPFDDYQLSADESKILFTTMTQRIYRHSTRAYNYVFDRASKKITAISPEYKQRYTTFSPDASMVAYIRDNNLYYYDLGTNKSVQVTTDGSINKVINGGTDWVYEEEFGFTRAFFWSPDNKKIAFYRFDEAKVKEFAMTTYQGLYPGEYRFKYPKAGEMNSSVSVHIYHLDTKKIVDVDLGNAEDMYIPRIKWTQDADKLCIYHMNRYQNNLMLKLTDAASGKSQLCL
jgi:dipeptidyl-peptidase-4